MVLHHGPDLAQTTVDAPLRDQSQALADAVHQYRLDSLTAEQAHQPPETDMQLFAQQLRENYYPDMPSDAVVEVALLAIAASQ